MDRNITRPSVTLGKRADRRQRRKANRPFALQTRVLTEGLDSRADALVMDSSESSKDTSGTNARAPAKPIPGIFPWVLTIIGIALLLLSCVYVVISAMSQRFTFDQVMDGLVFELLAVALLLWALWLYHRERHPLKAYRRSAYGVKDTSGDDSREKQIKEGNSWTFNNANGTEEFNDDIEREVPEADTKESAIVSITQDHSWNISDGQRTYEITEPLVIGTQPRNPFTTDEVLMWSIDDITGTFAPTHLALWQRGSKLFLRQLRGNQGRPTVIKVSQGLLTMEDKRNYHLSSPATLRIGDYEFTLGIPEERSLNHAA